MICTSNSYSSHDVDHFSICTYCRANGFLILFLWGLGTGRFADYSYLLDRLRPIVKYNTTPVVNTIYYPNHVGTNIMDVGGLIRRVSVWDTASRLQCVFQCVEVSITLMNALDVTDFFSQKLLDI